MSTLLDQSQPSSHSIVLSQISKWILLNRGTKLEESDNFLTTFHKTLPILPLYIGKLLTERMENLDDYQAFS